MQQYEKIGTMTDPRNVIDKYKGISTDEIIADLDTNGIQLEIAIENLEADTEYFIEIEPNVFSADYSEKPYLCYIQFSFKTDNSVIRH